MRALELLNLPQTDAILLKAWRDRDESSEDLTLILAKALGRKHPEEVLAVVIAALETAIQTQQDWNQRGYLGRSQRFYLGKYVETLAYVSDLPIPYDRNDPDLALRFASQVKGRLLPVATRSVPDQPDSGVP